MATKTTAKTPGKPTPSWSQIKTALADADRAQLLKLVQDLYAGNKANQAFLHARFSLGEDPLEPYKDVITRWINPPDLREPISVAKAKKAISDYKKALSQPADLAELAVFYCEEACDLLTNCVMDDEPFYDALVRMFAQALQYVLALPKAQQAKFVKRLEQVRKWGQDIGWGVGDDFNDLWAQAGLAATA